VNKYVAFIRAINVAGHASVNMSNLRTKFQRAGGSEVRTLIQSGNVLFEAAARDAAGIVRRVGNNLRGTFDNKPAIILRSIREIEAKRDQCLDLQGDSRLTGKGSLPP